MITRPIIPIWIMIIICLLVLVFSFRRLFPFILRIIMVILLFLANLRIMLPNGKAKSIAGNLDIVFAIDTTVSMNAEDYNGNNTRLSAVKEHCDYIIKELGGSRYSIISFDSISRINVPFTYDINIVNETIKSLKPPTNRYASGSGINMPIEDILLQLKNNVSDKKKEDKRVKILFFMSDGEDNTNTKIEDYKKLANYIVSGAVIGYGTPKGGYMKNPDSYMQKAEYVIDPRTNDKAVSKIGESSLKNIASYLNLDYINMKDFKDIKNKVSEIKNKVVFEFDEKEAKYYEETYYYFIIGFMVIFAIDFINFKRSL